ncbi:unknown [Prevotella sp. CAG:1092]|nr:unknown [Prevotella sp. CAG:1092]
MELSRLALGLNGLSDINESELEKYIKKCRFPNLTKKVVYERYIPELEKKRREEKETLVDY